MNNTSFSALVELQQGFFSWRQARNLGYSAERISTYVTKGIWKKILPRVLALAGIPVTRESRDRIAYLSAGEQAILCGPSAARMHQILVLQHKHRPCVAVPPQRNLRAENITFLRERIDEDDIENRWGYQVTKIPRTVFDCVRLLPTREAVELLDRALQVKWITYDDLLERINKRSGAPGVIRLRQLAKQVGIGGESEAERRFINLLNTNNLKGYSLGVPAYDNKGIIGKIDVVFAEAKIGIEIDGYAWHTDKSSFQRDRTRQNRLINTGWHMLRFTWRDIHDRPFAVVETIRAALTGEITGVSPAISPVKQSGAR